MKQIVKQPLFWFIIVMLCLVVLGCETVNKAVEDYRLGISDAEGLEQAHVIGDSIKTGIKAAFPLCNEVWPTLAGVVASFVAGFLHGKNKKQKREV